MKLYIIGIGSGRQDSLTGAAAKALSASDVIIGYQHYITQVQTFLPEKKYIPSPMGKEQERVLLALTEAQNQTVSLVCSGDPELYGMAGLALTLGEKFPDVQPEVIPGVTAAFSGGAVLGAPLTHDMAVISLSDLLTPWETIEKRLCCAAEGDFVVVLYNPASKGRTQHLRKACQILLTCRPPETVCGYVRHIGQAEETHGTLTLSELTEFQADMHTTVFIGNSETVLTGGHMITPRGYRV